MAETDDVLARWDQEEQVRKAQAKQNLFELLRGREDLAAVDVEYDGCGDSGQIECITFLDATGQAVEVEDTALTNAVEEYVYSLLPGGWENNEGAFGTVHVDVAAQKAHVEHSARFEDYDTSEWED